MVWSNFKRNRLTDLQIYVLVYKNKKRITFYEVVRDEEESDSAQIYIFNGFLNPDQQFQNIAVVNILKVIVF